MSVTVGLLGFGDRIRFERLVARLDGDPLVDEILLLWTGAPDSAAAFAETLSRRHAKIRYRIDARNLGSAGGYSSLLQWFEHEGSSDQLWLLDDDALPEPACLLHLLESMDRSDFDAANQLLLAARIDLPEIRAQLEATASIREPRPGVCVGVQLLDLFLPSRAAARPVDELPRLGWAPYGGLLIPRPAMPRLGLPDEKLFLYGDDTELTLRFTRAGGCIRLCPKAILHDSEPAWNAVGGDIDNMVRRVTLLDDRKAYYEARNRCYLGLMYAPGHPFVYWLNRTAFLAYAGWLALRHRRPARFRLIHRALCDGEQMAHAARPTTSP